MAVFEVKNRDFQRSPGDWMSKAKRGDTVVIVSSEGPPLTLKAGKPNRNEQFDWSSHFKWLNQQPTCKTNPVDDLRKADRR